MAPVWLPYSSASSERSSRSSSLRRTVVVVLTVQIIARPCYKTLATGFGGGISSET